MDSFANSDITYDDGQLNREPLPEEMVENGFKPPIRLPDGSIQDGDYLSANHLNYILNDIYKNLLARPKITEEYVDGFNGYRVFSNGDIEEWGMTKPDQATGIGVVTFNKIMPSSNFNAIVSGVIASNEKVPHSFMISGKSVSGITVTCTYADAKNSSYGPTGYPFEWRVFYRVKS